MSFYGTRQLVYMGALDPSGVGSVEFENLDFLAGQFVIRRIYMQATEAWATGSDTIEVNYRPTPGSATGEVDLGQFTIPVTVADGDSLFADLESLPGTDTTFQAASESGGGGLGGHIRHEAPGFALRGPGGAIRLEKLSGTSTAGIVNVWAEVYVDHNYAGGDNTPTELTVT